MELRRNDGELIGAGESLQEIINENRTDLREADLRWANLQGADLQGADLQGTNLRGADLQGANLREADLRKADLQGANLRGADLREADLRWADLDFSCWPLWCGSSNVKIDEKQAKQLLAHAFNVAKDFWPDGLTRKQKNWLNEFHKIQSDEFPRFE